MKKQKILLVKVKHLSSNPQPLWYGYLQELKKFFEYWLKWKLDVQSKIYIAPTVEMDLNHPESHLEIEAYADRFKEDYDLVVLITDILPPYWRGRSEAYSAPKYFVIKHTRSADWCPLFNTTHRLSHEFLHHFLRLQGLPHEIWQTQVHLVDLVHKDWDKWKRFRWWNFYYRFIRRRSFYRTSERGARYLTVGGEFRPE